MLHMTKACPDNMSYVAKWWIAALWGAELLPGVHCPQFN